MINKVILKTSTDLKFIGINRLQLKFQKQLLKTSSYSTDMNNKFQNNNTDNNRGYTFINNMFDVKELEKLEFKPFKEGIEIFRIFPKDNEILSNGDEVTSTGILKFKKGAKVPEHLHPGYEILIPLTGTQKDSRFGTYDPKSMLINHPNSTHSAFVQDENTYLFAVWQKPVIFK